MAIPAVPFLLGVLAGSAFTYFYKSKEQPGRRTSRSATVRYRRPLSVDAEPVEDTAGFEARFER